ncbi:hypothetical protein RUM43_012002 [Polyplax serrata]|uniref:Uncharacterized protein n=1 Tax=Polyplax serrata TaxID=468196 RepID=A0AAN8P2W9_POLSC
MNRKKSTSKRSTGNTRSVAEKRSRGRMVRLRGGPALFPAPCRVVFWQLQKVFAAGQHSLAPVNGHETNKAARVIRIFHHVKRSGPYFVLFLCCLTNEPANDRNSQLLGSFLRQGDVVLSDKEELSGVSRRGETKELKNQKERYRVGKVQKALEQVKAVRNQRQSFISPKSTATPAGHPTTGTNHHLRTYPSQKQGYPKSKPSLTFLLEKKEKGYSRGGLKPLAKKVSPPCDLLGEPSRSKEHVLQSNSDSQDSSG